MMMTTCPREEDLVLFLKSELDQDSITLIAGHVDTCDQCQRTLDQLSSIDSFDHELTTVSDSSEGENDVLNHLLKRLVSDQSRGSKAKVQSASSWSIDFPGDPTFDAPLGMLGDYAVKERIADGGHGAVYRAHDVRLNREVAIKVLRHCSDESRARFQREARAAAALKNEHIVTVYGSGDRSDFPPYLVMEFVRGESLWTRLKERGPLSAVEAATLVRQAAIGAACAHEQGLVHRDIKPSNVLIDAVSGIAKLTDFGLVRDESSDSLLTVENAIAGTPAYMSPEQITNPSLVDGLSDVYSLGVMLYELLTGVVPFRGVLRMTLMQVVHDDATPPRVYNDTVPQDLQTICLKAMAKEPERRYRDAISFAADLKNWLDGESIEARPVTRFEKAVRWSRRNPLTASLAVGVLSLLVLLTSGSLYVANRFGIDAENARVNASLSQAQRDAMINTLSRLVFQFQETFEREDLDLDAIQRSSLQIALDGLQRIDLREQFDADVEYHIAAGHRKMGEIYDRDLGRDVEAKASWDRASEILNRLMPRSVERDRDAALLLLVRWDQGDLEVREGEVANAVQFFQSAIDLAQDFVDSSDSELWKTRLAVSHYKKSEAFLGLSQYSDSLNEIRLAVELAVEVGSDFFEEETAVEMIDLNLLVGNILLKQQDHEGAADYFRLVNEEAERRHANPNEELFLYPYLFLSLESLSKISEAKGDADQASSYQDSVVELHQDLLSSVETAGSDHLMSVYLIYSSVDVNYHLLDEKAMEMKYQQMRCEFLDKWVTHYPNDSLGVIERAISYQELAESTRDVGELAEAAKLLDKAIGLYRSVSPSDANSPLNAIWLLEALIEAAELQQQRLGEVRQDTLQEAVEQFEIHKAESLDEDSPTLILLKERLDQMIGATKGSAPLL